MTIWSNQIFTVGYQHCYLKAKQYKICDFQKELPLDFFMGLFIAPLWKSGSILDLPCPSGILWFCHSVIIQMKLEYLWGQLANVDQILYEASLGWMKGCIRFWDRLDQNSGFHGNRNRPLTYNGENDVSTFSQLFLIRFFLYLQVTRICIRSGMSTNFGQIGPLTLELAALERLRNFL